MRTAEYLRTNYLFQRLKSGPHGHLVERYAAFLFQLGLSESTTRQSLSVVSNLLSWIARGRLLLTDLDEHTIDRYLRHRAKKRPIQPGDRKAFKRWLLVLRDAGSIAPPVLPQILPQHRVSTEFGAYLLKERGLTRESVQHYLPTVRQFLREVRPARGDLARLRQSDVVRYVERHARDWGPRSAQTMCSSLRGFLRYLHLKGINPLPLAECVPSVREWKFAHLPSYLSAEQVQSVLDSCDRTTPIGRRDYAVLMILAKLGLRAREVSSLTLDNINWRSGEMHIYAKGRELVAMPIPQDVGAAIVSYLRAGRPKSSCRRLFLRAYAPHTGFVYSHTISTIAKTAIERGGIQGFPRRGAYLFRHSLATELLRAGATLSEIGQLLRHKSHNTTRIYAKVDIDALRPLSLAWPGGAR